MEQQHRHGCKIPVAKVNEKEHMPPFQLRCHPGCPAKIRVGFKLHMPHHEQTQEKIFIITAKNYIQHDLKP